jgi:hypothetical protein
VKLAFISKDVVRDAGVKILGYVEAELSLAAADMAGSGSAGMINRGPGMWMDM